MNLKNYILINNINTLMSLYKNRIVITGGTGRFGLELKKIKNKYRLFFPLKKELNILKLKSILKLI